MGLLVPLSVDERQKTLVTKYKSKKVPPFGY